MWPGRVAAARWQQGRGSGLDAVLFMKSVLAGMAIAAPVGPVGVLCLRRTVVEGRLPGLVSGLGAALADALYGCIAAFGLAALAGLLLDHQDALQLAGGIFLVVMGVRILKAPARPAAEARPGGLFAQFASTFVLTAVNPITILAFAGIFAALGVIVAANDPVGSLVLVAGVFVGSSLWWLGIVVVASLLHGRLEDRHLIRVNMFSGTLVLAFGVGALVDLLLHG